MFVGCHYTISYGLQSQRLIYLLFFLSFFFHFVQCVQRSFTVCVWSGIFSVECSFALWPSRNGSVIVNCVFPFCFLKSSRTAITIVWFVVWVSLMRRQIKSVGQKQYENGLVWSESPVAMIHWLIVLWFQDKTIRWLISVRSRWHVVVCVRVKFYHLVQSSRHAEFISENFHCRIDLTDVGVLFSLLHFRSSCWWLRRIYAICLNSKSKSITTNEFAPLDAVNWFTCFRPNDRINDSTFDDHVTALRLTTKRRTILQWRGIETNTWMRWKFNCVHSFKSNKQFDSHFIRTLPANDILCAAAAADKLPND